MTIAARLPHLAARWTAYLPSTATQLRPTVVRGTGGGRTTTWVTVGTTAARWQPNRYRASEAAGAVPALQATLGLTLMLPATVQVQPRDRFQHPDGSLWEVRGSDTGRSYDYGRQVDVTRVEA